MPYGCLAWLSPFIWPFPWPASAWTTLHGRAAFPKVMMLPTSAASLVPIFRCRILSVRLIVLVVDSRLLRFPLQKFPPHEKAGKPQALQSRRSRFGIVSPAGVQPDSQRGTDQNQPVQRQCYRPTEKELPRTCASKPCRNTPPHREKWCS